MIEHHIQKYIIQVLTYQKTARFRDLRPPKTDTNLFSYHLKLLVKKGMIDKASEGYRLSTAGLMYVDRISTQKFTPRSQPKIVTMLVVQNSEGQVLLQKRSKQPFIDTWTLPHGKLHIDDVSIEAAAVREAKEKLGVEAQTIRHAGDAYIRVHAGEEMLSAVFAHIFYFETDTVAASETITWVAPLRLGDLSLAPGVEAIVTRTFFNDPSFFVEFNEDWYS